MTAPPLVLAALALCGGSLGALAWLLLAPRPAALPLSRRRTGAVVAPSLLNRATSTTTTLIGRVLARRGRVHSAAAMLEQAGVARALPEFALLVLAGTLAAAALGALVGGVLPALLLGLVVPVATRVTLGVRAGRRRRAFADQLEDSLQLMASSLRAGHSMLQALQSVAREADSPTAEEFARVINESRMGRSVGAALDETAARMASEDFVWVTQAIAINREVGGNLAEVLDGVGHTIRERNQIRRQVKALSAEGTLSAYVLIALPVGIIGFLAVTNASYIATFTESLLGYALIGVAVVMMAVGALWLRKVVRIKF